MVCTAREFGAIFVCLVEPVLGTDSVATIVKEMLDVVAQDSFKDGRSRFKDLNMHQH